MYLELAEGHQPDYLQQPNPIDYYIAVPNEEGGFSYIREDKFDDLPDWAFDEILEAQPYMSEGDYLSSKADRKARRAARKQKKLTKKSDSKRKKELKMMRKESRGVEREARQVRRQEKHVRKGERDGTGWQDIMGTAKDIFGKGQQEEYYEPADRGFEVTAGYSDPTTGILKSPVVIGGVLLLVGGIAWAIASRTKKK